MIVWNWIVRNRAALRAPVFTAVLIMVNKDWRERDWREKD